MVPLRLGEGLLLFFPPGLVELLLRELDLDFAELFLDEEGDLDLADWGRESDIFPEPALFGLLLEALVGLGLLEPGLITGAEVQLILDMWLISRYPTLF